MSGAILSMDLIFTVRLINKNKRGRDIFCLLFRYLTGWDYPVELNIELKKRYIYSIKR